MNTKLSKNFNRSEFECKCGCGFDTVDTELLTVLQDLRDYFEKKIRINSGARCIKHNRNVGGEEYSQHLKAKAADIEIEDTSPRDVAGYLKGKYPGKYGIKVSYSHNYVHVDVRVKEYRKEI